MKSRRLLFVLLFAWLPGALGQYKAAMPGYRYEFPRDHFNHPEFQTEWWYTTGNLIAADGHQYGFELTFFRQGMDRDPRKKEPWDIQDLYVAHLALSDLDGGKFYHMERTNRAGPGLAGVDEKQKRIWNGNWEIRWNGEEEALTVADEKFSLSFTLRSEKPPVIHGENGVSQKAAGPGHASHYISFTRLQTRGTIDGGGFPAGFHGGDLDERRYRSEVSGVVEHGNSQAGAEAGGEDSAEIAGAGRWEQAGAELLGRRDCDCGNTWRRERSWRWIFGNDWV
jgi:predicted secreted hydrolase